MKLDDKLAGPAYLQVASGIREAITSGELTPGEKLPAGPKLASTFGVALMTVRRAIETLQSEGLLRSAPGVGVFVAAAGTDDSDLATLRADFEALQRRVEQLEQLVLDASQRSGAE
ncbi:regulatory GntR family protein [Kribbella antiqua]|uniref:Regulatory GntR family protein n=1 Tax=Kribbella antiqua TaxID=2512217 RepID=A0A4R2IR01_9ACTN|nr:GntR family transcriptional regulator [Kribbella antiqua]TCO45205.1 regulatory GntR family protein [Kribbella antiqua]